MRVSLALPVLLSLGAVTPVDWRPLHGSQAAPWSVDRPVPAPLVFGEGTISTADDEMDAAFTPDGRSVYFTKNHFGQRLGVSATRADSLGRSDIYRSRWQNGSYQPPENLGSAVNSAATEVDSYIAPDQSFIVFAGFGRPDDMGNGDLYISEQQNGVWSAARHLGAGINSTAREYCPAASPDGRYFFFTSFRGFGDRVPDHPWTCRELRAGLNGVLNGWGNVYQIDMAALRSGGR